MRKLRVSLAQINSTVGDLSGNLQKIFDAIERAKQQQADLIAFPEMAITGYPPEDLILKSAFITDNLNSLDQVLEWGQGITIALGFIDRQEETLYNAVAVLHNGTIQMVYHKIHLPNYGVFDEHRYFHAGKATPVFLLQGILIGVNICEDIWQKEGPTQAQVREGGAELIVNINASPYQLGKRVLREELLSRRSKENGVAIAYVNMVGGQDELVFDGGSLIFDREGSCLARAAQFEEDLLTLDLSFEDHALSHFPAPKIVLGGERKEQPKQPLSFKMTPPFSEDKEIYQALVSGVSDYIHKNGFEKALIGLSGGIDSALTAVLAVEALGRDNVVAVFMPSQYTSSASFEDAESLAENLGIRLITLPIEEAFESYLSLLSASFEGRKPDATEENLQARIRGNLLMALSNKFGWLVLTTGNKSEMSVGYATLYGDMAGGFAVIKDIWKTTVYRLSRLRKQVIPSRIFERPPSAELRPDQCDQDSLPPYEVLDTILKAYVEEDLSAEEIVEMGFEARIVSEVIGLVEASEFKRRQAPPGIKITARALGKDRRMPITNAYHRFQIEKKDLKDTTQKRRKKIA